MLHYFQNATTIKIFKKDSKTVSNHSVKFTCILTWLWLVLLPLEEDGGALFWGNSLRIQKYDYLDISHLACSVAVT